MFYFNMKLFKQFLAYVKWFHPADEATDHGLDEFNETGRFKGRLYRCQTATVTQQINEPEQADEPQYVVQAWIVKEVVGIVRITQVETHVIKYNQAPSLVKARLIILL